MFKYHGKITRVGIFYDGNYLQRVSSYYSQCSWRAAGISVAGLNNFVTQEIAKEEGVEARFCQIVEAHFFRGRSTAIEAELQNTLYKDREFDDMLTREGIATHYLPFSADGRREKGVDVWLAIEALQMAMEDKLDVITLVTGDADFVPLVRKLQSLGIRVALTGWDIKLSDNDRSKVAQALLDQVDYPMMMRQIIEDRSRRDDPLINGLFLPQHESRSAAVTINQTILNNSNASNESSATPKVARGRIVMLREYFGYIASDDGTKFYFHPGEILNREFSTLKIGDPVQFALGTNSRGECAKRVEVLEQ